MQAPSRVQPHRQARAAQALSSRPSQQRAQPLQVSITLHVLLYPVLTTDVAGWCSVRVLSPPEAMRRTADGTAWAMPVCMAFARRRPSKQLSASAQHTHLHAAPNRVRQSQSQRSCAWARALPGVTASHLPLAAVTQWHAERGLCAADGPAPNPQALLNSLSSVVTAASSVANAQQDISNAASGGNGNILQSAGSTAQALQVKRYPPHECQQPSAHHCCAWPSADQGLRAP